MKVLFILIIKDSFGEREHAINFALQLLNNQIQSYFLISSEIKDSIKIFGFETFELTKNSDKNKELLTYILDSLKPKLIICCEYYCMFPYIIEILNKSKIPIASMDATGLGEELNSDPLKIGKKIGYFTKIPPEIPKISPCPINDPTLKSEKNLFYWRLYPKKFNSNNIKQKIKNSLGIKGKIVFMAISKWSYYAACFIGLKDYYPFLINMLKNYFSNLEEKIHIFFIAPFNIESFKSEDIFIYSLNLLPSETYENLLLSSDLVISDNIIQTSLGKALYCDIPTLVLININHKPLTIYQYNIFPLKPIFPLNSKYCETLEICEIFDYKITKEKIKQILFDPDYIKKLNQRRQNYFKLVNKLPLATDIINTLLHDFFSENI